MKLRKNRTDGCGSTSLDELSNSVLLCPDEGTLKKLKGYLTYDLYKFPSSLWVNIQKKLSSKYTKFDMGSSSISTIAWQSIMPKKALTDWFT